MSSRVACFAAGILCALAALPVYSASDWSILGCGPPVDKKWFFNIAPGPTFDLAIVSQPGAGNARIHFLYAGQIQNIGNIGIGVNGDWAARLKERTCASIEVPAGMVKLCKVSTTQLARKVRLPSPEDVLVLYAQAGKSYYIRAGMEMLEVSEAQWTKEAEKCRIAVSK